VPLPAPRAGSVRRAVLDTSVLVSGAILSAGAPVEILTAWRERRFDLVIGPTILSELDRVLHLPKIARRYSLDPQDVQGLLDLLSARAVVVTEKHTVSAVLRDPKDTPILSCAVEGQADYIVTGDRDLLDLRQFRDIPIVSPAVFRRMLLVGG
jgi:putative PIN family toxin of toxin-antitoxin system